MYNEKTIEKLKQKILDLVIRGKLVPQDPNDEPASILLEKIRKEKEKLIKEGKIKKPKEDSFIFKGSDNCYYENVNGKIKNIQDEIPFEIPESWCWVRQHNLCWLENGFETNSGNLPYLEAKVIRNQKAPTMKTSGVLLKQNSKVILVDGENSGEVMIIPFIGYMGSTFRILMMSEFVIEDYIKIYFDLYKNEYKENKTGSAIPHLNKRIFSDKLVALPPFLYQKQVSNKIKDIFNNIIKVNSQFIETEKYKEKLKNKVLESIFSPNSSYKSYYENDFNLGDILEYEQPAPYIVDNTDYNDNFDTPVLTPGKTFILGYTDEKDGIYRADKENKVIIFDDFTTASRLVDFDFKVKSSAMKILHISDTSKFDIDYIFYLLQTINIIVDTHKRFWISEYASLKVKIHTFDEQVKIKKRIKSIFEIIDKL